MKKLCILIALLMTMQLFIKPNYTAYAQDNDVLKENYYLSNGLSWINDNQLESKTWNSDGSYTSEITDSLEKITAYVDANSIEKINNIADLASDYYYRMSVYNIDCISRYLSIANLYDEWIMLDLISCQNYDGGFGLDKGYASDIIDSKLALKALTDCGESEAMTRAALYIASLQNEDGGFGYQQGLLSDKYLTADIANILVDTVSVNPYLSYVLENTFISLDDYLDSTFPALENLSAENLDEVYQHFNTALYELKREGRYDVSSYYDLQAEDGGVFDDPMATALYLELLVREQNALVAKIDTIAITNDRGYAVSAFNSNENVNIRVLSEYETAKANMKVSVIKPDGTEIVINGADSVWNTADNEDGEYTVRAEIIRTSNSETAVSLEQTFRIQHYLAVDSITLSLSQAYSKIGETTSVDIIADFDMENYSDDDLLSICWSVTDASAEEISGDTVTLTDASAKSLVLGSFTPDTSERNVYVIRAELLSGENQIAQATTNYFVSDKSVGMIYETDKEYLTEIEDNANVKISLKDERVVDLILTTSSDDTELISKNSAEVESIKEKLEQMGYIVNLSNVSTSYLSAKDTFAWTEYDHYNYPDRCCSVLPKHIVYDDKNIQMLGYGVEPLKDFLLVPDDNPSKKILEFDLQRDQSTDWHTLDGGGFLFNIGIEDDIFSGYCVLINRNGLNLYQLKDININDFRNGKACNFISEKAKLLTNIEVSNLLDKHHIKLIADKDTVSLWKNDVKYLDEFKLPEMECGNSYGPITSYQSHYCSVRSSFTFSNITMKSITGEKLVDILDNYNFESGDSRYVICLGDSKIDELNDEESLKIVSEKIKEKKITFIGLGNDKTLEQYQNLLELIPDRASSYLYTDPDSMNNIKQSIVDAEEAKRIINSESVIANDLCVIGELSDGSVFTEKFEKLHEGETISFNVPVKLEKLTSGIDAVLLRNVRLDYTDENGTSRSRIIDKITLPVIGAFGKITNQVSTDKATYYEHENVSIFDRIHNNSDIRAAKGLTNVIAIIDSEGNIIKEYSKPLSEIMTKSYAEVSETWNVADQSEGQYIIISNVYDGEALVAESQAVIEVIHHELPQYELTGYLNTSGKLFKADETVGISRYIENIGRYDIANGTITIKIIDTAHEKVVYEREEVINLTIGENNTDSFSVVPANDFTSRGGKEYLITYEVTTENGQTIELPGDGFMLDGFDFTFMGDDVLFSMNDDASIKGIQMSGWLMNVCGSMHSNSDIEANCSEITVNGNCSYVSNAQFNTGQTIIGEKLFETEYTEFPDIMSVIKPELQETELIIENGWTSENDTEFRIYGNNVTACSDIFSTKNLVIDPSSCFAIDVDEGVVICSEGDITIRSTDVDIKGIIYAPNGTVRIESNNFSLHGRIIAKNIIFQGSVFTGETYEGDLNLICK